MSAELLLGVLLLAAVLAAVAVWRSHQLLKQLETLQAALRRAEAAGQEQATRIAALETLRDGQQLTEYAIATGTAVVKEMHKGIADIPFSVLEAIPATRAPAKVLRGLHDSISDGVYAALGNLNKAVGRELRKSVPLDAPPTVQQAVPEALPASEEEPPAALPPSSKDWG